VDFSADKTARYCDYKAQDIKRVQVTPEGGGAATCRIRCKDQPGCTHYVWGKWNGGSCWMKRAPFCPGRAFFQNKTAHKEMVCGYMDGEF